MGLEAGARYRELRRALDQKLRAEPAAAETLWNAYAAHIEESGLPHPIQRGTSLERDRPALKVLTEAVKTRLAGRDEAVEIGREALTEMAVRAGARDALLVLLSGTGPAEDSKSSPPTDWEAVAEAEAKAAAKAAEKAAKAAAKARVRAEAAAKAAAESSAVAALKAAAKAANPETQDEGRAEDDDEDRDEGEDGDE